MGRALGGTIPGLTQAPGYLKRLLVEISDPITPYRYTDNESSITQTIESVSRTFVPAIFTISGLGQSQELGIDNATLALQNVDNVASAIVLGVTGVRNRTIQIWEGWFDPVTQAWVDAIKIMDGRLNGADFDETQATIVFLAYNTPWAQAVPGLLFLPTCVLKYKGSLCQYAGGLTSCDRTFIDCTTHANTQHFFGFRYLPDPNKKIYWQGNFTQPPTRSNN